MHLDGESYNLANILLFLHRSLISFLYLAILILKITDSGLTLFPYFLPDKKVMSKIALFPCSSHPIFPYFNPISDKKVVSRIGIRFKGKGNSLINIFHQYTLQIQ
jgi:hypothetical protein